MHIVTGKILIINDYFFYDFSFSVYEYRKLSFELFFVK